ncbi:MAG: cyclic pyranopterin phosphate synthase MoaA, partial [Muricauda sp.]|nr:cyclic pyranopterin phosphate synthase MoaA [Allomuricauda sp.]
ETDLLTPFRNGEKIESTILEAIKSKKHSRDGMDVKMDAEHYEQNRSMISIGG